MGPVRKAVVRDDLAAAPPELRVVQPGPPQEPEPFWLVAATALRPHQWAKNLLLFGPLVLAHQVTDLAKWGQLGAAFAMYCACASAVYLLNDTIDLDADRRHPVKQHRPIASGALSVTAAMALMAALLAAAFGASAALMPWRFTAMLAVYFGLTTAYSVYIKQTIVLDVLVLAGLYTHRLLCGGIVAGVEVSQWLMSFSMFFFISLALLKRFVELRRMAPNPEAPANRRGYLPDDAEMIQNLGLTSGYLSILVLCLYVSSNAVEKLYRHPDVLWLIAPALFYWISRTWLLARRGLIDEDPLVAAVKDVRSYVVGALCAVFLAVGAI